MSEGAAPRSSPRKLNVATIQHQEVRTKFGRLTNAIGDKWEAAFRESSRLTVFVWTPNMACTSGLMRDVIVFVEVAALVAIFGGIVAGNIWLLYSWQ